MSPRSKGRPKGRGRPAPKGHGRVVRPLSPVDRALRSARDLGDLEAPLRVQLVASARVGEQLAAAAMGRRQPERDLATELGAELAGGRSDAAYRALLALRTIAAPEEVALIDSLLHEQGLTSATRPPWADRAVLTPVNAWRLSDPWGSDTLAIIGYDDPEPHELAVGIATVGGLRVESVTLVEPGTAEQLLEDAPERYTLAPVDPSSALARVAAAINMTDMSWPPQRDPDYVELRALTLARSRPYAVKRDWEGISDEDRRRLIDDFAEQAGLSEAENVVEILADTFIDFGDGYLADGVLAWSPLEVEHFMLDWVLRKVVLDPQDWEALPRVLKAWLDFALRRREIAEQDIVPVVEVVDELTPQFRELAGDEAAAGPAKQMLMALLEEDVDLDDGEALQQAMRANNARQLAERLRQGTSE